MKDLTIRLITDFLPEEKLNRVTIKYDVLKNQRLTSLGVDSLDLIGVTLKLEELTGIEIDYDEFDIECIDTISKLDQFMLSYEETIEGMVKESS